MDVRNITNLNILTVPQIKRVRSILTMTMLVVISGFVASLFFSLKLVAIMLPILITTAFICVRLGQMYEEIPNTDYESLIRFKDNKAVTAYIDAIRLSGRTYLITKEQSEIIAYLEDCERINNSLKAATSKEMFFSSYTNNADNEPSLKIEPEEKSKRPNLEVDP